MSPRHRPYRPKIKGCYECSQRRISCDRTTPECTKCVSRGLQCSGLDLRYRFTKGVSVRGKWAGESVNSLYQRLSEKPRHYRPGRTTVTKPPIGSCLSGCCDISEVLADERHVPESQEMTAPQSGLTRGKHHEVSNADLLGLPETNPSENEDDFPLNFLDCSTSYSVDGVSVLSYSCDDEEVPRPHDNSLSSQQHLAQTSRFMNSMTRLLYEPLPDNIPPWQQRLLSHYSDRIAVEMIAIDGRHNGWRHIILPIAHTDGLVMSAVLTVSAFHISLQEGTEQQLDDSLFMPPRGFLSDDRTSAEFLYDLTIRGLKQRRDFAKSDFDAKQSIIVTILVLLTTVMVNGRTDFPILFGMLDAAIKVIGGECQLGGSELGDFIIRQVRKMRVYAAPLISERVGLNILSSPSHWEQLFDCIRYCSQTEPKHAEALSCIENLVRQAHDIYLRQALTGSMIFQTEDFTRESIDRLEMFKSTLETFPTGSPGKQVLVWATFIAASDCILDEHKAFFENVLIENYNRSKFANVLKGLAQLRHIWARRSEGIRWTHLLPQGQLFLM